MKRNKSILIVEDEQTLGILIKEFLDPLYESVVLCTEALEARELLKHKSFSLILSDVTMPGLMGHHLVALLRSMGRMDPIIFVTGNVSNDILLAAVRLGVSDVILKPFGQDEFVKVVDRVLEIEKRRDAISAHPLRQALTEEQLKGHKKMMGLLMAASTSESD